VGAQTQSNQVASDSNNEGAQLIKPPLLRIFVTQFLVLLVISTSMLMLDKTAALSALVGGSISIVPNMYFARWAFRFSGAKSAARVAQSFYRGEAGKFVLTAVLFASIFMLMRPLNAVVIFLTYIFMMALNWMLALRFINR
jgi:ATP synthase protein I